MKSAIWITILIALSVIAKGAEPVGSSAKLNLPGQPITLDLGEGVTLEAVSIPAGKFMMGRPADAKPYAWSHGNELFDDRPAHEVTISKAFYLGKYEVTNAQFERVMGYSPSKDRTPNFPVNGGGGFNVKKPAKSAGRADGFKSGPLHFEAMQAFCQKVSELTGKTVRLPTEAEWEYAARAGGPPTTFDKASFEEVRGLQDSPMGQVGRWKPNPWGLYDLFGNVSEMTQDWLAKYTADPVVDPRGPDKPPAENPLKVIRGGGFYGDSTFAASTTKFAKDINFTRGDVGFRVVVEVPKTR